VSSGFNWPAHRAGETWTERLQGREEALPPRWQACPVPPTVNVPLTPPPQEEQATLWVGKTQRENESPSQLPGRHPPPAPSRVPIGAEHPARPSSGQETVPAPGRSGPGLCPRLGGPDGHQAWRQARVGRRDPAVPLHAPATRPRAALPGSGPRFRTALQAQGRPGPRPRHAGWTGPRPGGPRGPLTQADDSELRPGARRPLRPRGRPLLHAGPGHAWAPPPALRLGLRLRLGLVRRRRGLRQRLCAAVVTALAVVAAAQARRARGHIGRGVTGPAGAQRWSPGRTPHPPRAPSPDCHAEAGLRVGTPGAPMSRVAPGPAPPPPPPGPPRACVRLSVRLSVCPPAPPLRSRPEAAPRLPRDAPGEPQWS
jgi:hypothetical protein